MRTIAERLVVRVVAAAQGHTCVFADHVAAGTFNADVTTDVERAVGPDIDVRPFLSKRLLGQKAFLSAIAFQAPE
jgi:hypothetical protein